MAMTFEGRTRAGTGLARLAGSAGAVAHQAHPALPVTHPTLKQDERI